MDQKLLNDVETYGWHVLKVFGDDTNPGFGYSVGLFKTFGHPEIIIIGLNLDLTHSIINNVGDDIRAGKVYESGKFYSELLEGFDCYFTSVGRLYYQEYPTGLHDGFIKGKSSHFCNVSILRLKVYIHGRLNGLNRLLIFSRSYLSQGCWSHSGRGRLAR